MSDLKNKIQENLKSAMRAHEQQTVTTLRGLMAAIKQHEVDSRTEASEEKIKDIIQKEVKKCRDALQYATEQQRPELIEKNNIEIALMQAYLGAALDTEALQKVIEDAVADGADSIGKIMGQLNKSYKGRFDGRAASEIAKGLLTR